MRLTAILTLLAVHTSGVVAAPFTYNWVDWFAGGQPLTTNPNAGYKSTGKITTPTAQVDVTFTSTGNIHQVQTGAPGEIDYWTKGGANNPYESNEVANRPTGTDIIALDRPTTVTLTFSQAIVDPVLAIISTNGNTYSFDSDFEILSLSGQNGKETGYWGDGEWTRQYNAVTNKYDLVSGTTTGKLEPHGTIKMFGSFSSIQFKTIVGEFWHGFTLGVKSTQTEALQGVGLGPAGNTARCLTWGDPHVVSFSGAQFDCHVAGPSNYYNTTSAGVTTTVDTIHSPLAAIPSIMMNSDVFVFVSGIGSIHADINNKVWFTPTAGVATEITLLPVAANNNWYELTPGLFIIRNPGGVANKFGVYAAAAQMTVYLQSAIYLGQRYWNVEIIAVRLASDTGLCFAKTCNTPPPTPPACAAPVTEAAIAAACLAAVGSTSDPFYAFCVLDVTLACDLTVATGFVPPNNPPAPLTPTTTPAPTTPSIVGDPQFMGLQGQSYQVHGADDTIFGLISTPRMQMNGLFTFIGVGGNCNYNHTQCWSHPGTYISQLGFRIQHHDGKEDKLHIVSGSHSQGLHVLVNGAKIPLDASFHLGSSARVKVVSKDRVHVHIHELFIVEITNSDHFFNMGVQLLRRDWLAAGAPRVTLTTKSKANALSVYPPIELHGLLGCTWRNVLYPHNRVYEGDVMDYAIEGDDMFDTKFVYTQYAKLMPKGAATVDDMDI